MLFYFDKTQHKLKFIYHTFLSYIINYLLGGSFTLIEGKDEKCMRKINSDGKYYVTELVLDIGPKQDALWDMCKGLFLSEAQFYSL